jgi:hypothetical protein
MTPGELQDLINKTLDKVVQEEDSMIIINKLNHIEQLILNLEGKLKRGPGSSSKVEPNQRKQKGNQLNPKEGGKTKKTKHNAQKAGEAKNNGVNGELSAEMKKLNQKLETQNDRINQLQKTLNKQNQQANKQNQEGKKQKKNVTVIHNPETQHKNVVSSNNEMLHRGYSAFIGYSFGDVNSLNIGIRKYYGFRNTSFFFMPTAYIAVAHNYGFGVSANGIYQFSIKKKPRLNPYAGLGLGINFVEGKFSLNPNFIIGTLYRVGGSGSVLFDYTIRGNFKYNQLAIGYRFGF